MNEIKINDELYGGVTSALDISYDNSNTEATSTNLQDVIDEIWKELSLRALRDYEVVYMVDTGIGYKENVTLGSTALLPTSFTPTKEGYTFVGWRSDSVASNEVLPECTVGEDPITLWAVFRKEVILTYNGNSQTAGDNFTSVDYIYYNNGNILNPTFTLVNNSFTKTNYKFVNWALGSVGGTQYAPGATLNVTSDTTLYAVWTPTKQTGSYSTKAGYAAYTYYTVYFPVAFATTPSVSLTSDTFNTTLSSVSNTSFYFGAKRKTSGNTTTAPVNWVATV